MNVIEPAVRVLKLHDVVEATGSSDAMANAANQRMCQAR
jgi:hypothetical protein